MSYNYQQGKDPITGLDNPNTYFVNGGDLCGDSGGSDATGDGSSGNPWRTIDYAIANVVNSTDIVVLASGTYNINSSINNVELLGDTLRKVIIEDPSGTLEAVARNNKCSRIVFKNFNNVINTSIHGTYSISTFEDCVFLDCNNVTCKFNINFVKSIFINVTLLQESGITNLNNCALFNVAIPHSGINFIRIYRSYMDQLTKWVSGVGSSIITIYNYSFIHDKSLFEDGGYNSGLTYDGTEMEESTNPSMLNSTNFLDLSVKTGSSLLINDVDENVGGFYLGDSWGPDNSDFVNMISSNPNLELVNSELLPTTSVAIGQTVYTDEIIFTPSLRARLTYWFPIGINDFCHVELQVKTVDVGEDINIAQWKTYKQGERMTKNSNGTATGEIGYDWTDNGNVDYAQASFRYAITKIA